MEEMTYHCYPSCLDTRHMEMITLERIVGMLRGDTLQTLTATLRRHLAEGRPAEADRMKRSHFPAFIPACHCGGVRRKDAITAFTGLCQVDFDKLSPDDVERIMESLPRIPQVVLGYRTLSGRGVHLYYRWTTPQATPPPYDASWHSLYVQAFRQGNERLAALLSAPYDPSCEPAVKLSLLCHDPRCHYRPDAPPLVIDPTLSLPKRPAAAPATDAATTVPVAADAPDVGQVATDARRMTTDTRQMTVPVAGTDLCEYALQQRLMRDTYTEGNRHNFLFRLCCLLSDYGVPQHEAAAFIASRFADYHDDQPHHLAAEAYEHARADFGRLSTPRVQCGGRGASSRTHVHYYNAAPAAASVDDDEASSPGREVWVDGSEPYCRLPLLHQGYAWPRWLERIMAHGSTPEQRDVLLLSALTTFGAMLGRHLRCLYGNRWQYPCMQTFIVALPASGKSVITWLRRFAEPMHNAIRGEVEKEMEAYRQEKAAYDVMGRQRATKSAPQMPPNRLFIIPGNNTGTGILQNIIESGGTAFICEEEADTVSAAISGEYGKWSDTLRKLFDQERLAYNRRTNQEYRETSHTCVSVLLSGTPDQFKTLIPSAANGLFSRQLFYYMPRVLRWKSQFSDVMTTDVGELFYAMGREWMQTLDGLRREGVITLHLTASQRQAFDERFSTLFARAVSASGGEMNGSVVRLGVNTVRMLSVVALLRALEPGGGVRLKPSAALCSDNLKDGVVGSRDLQMDDDDFQAVLELSGRLYHHASHVLSFLDSSELRHRGIADRDTLLEAMPHVFTRADFLEAAATAGIPQNTAASWLQRALRQGGLLRLEKGRYAKKAETI